jgi:glycerophosphoryl diester phosphodiesterase
MQTRILAVLVVVISSCAPAEPKPYLTRFDRPLHICHQGGEDLFPSNTLFAYSECVRRYDTDVLEIDIHSTSDGFLVSIHDETVDRTTDGTGLVKEKSLFELQELDAAFWFKPETSAGFPYRGQGITIPTLDEIFEAFPDKLTNIEIKQVDPPIEQELVDKIVAFDMVEKVCLGSFDDGVADRLRNLLPEACHYAPEDMATGYYVGTRLHTTGFAPPPIDAFALPPFSGKTEVIDERLMEAAHLEGKHVWAWTIDDEDEMRRLFELGVDGIMTNRPDRLSLVMKELALR